MNTLNSGTSRRKSALGSAAGGLFCLLLACGGGTSGTGGVTGGRVLDISGVVVDVAGNPLPNVTVREAGGAFTTSDANGAFSLDAAVNDTQIELKVESASIDEVLVVEDVPADATNGSLQVTVDESAAAIASSNIVYALPESGVPDPAPLPEEGPDEQPAPEDSPAPDPEPLCVDRCGDGICAEIVCFGEGCECAETSSSCSADCSGGDEGTF